MSVSMKQRPLHSTQQQRRPPREASGWVVTERLMPQLEEGLRWVQLSYGRNWEPPPGTLSPLDEPLSEEQPATTLGA